MKNLSRLILSLIFIGHIPLIPGTFASFVCCFILFFLPNRSIFLDITVISSIILLSVGLVHYNRPSQKDPRYIVLDEIVGMWITMSGHKTTILSLSAGFILFRFFDIMKPYPVKKLEGLPNGWGIVADDILAGVYANFSLWLIKIVQKSLL
ncbi:MAG: phosphatidylglycerophosphatase A [Deltaproteobacteria bacterium]|nr:phosphatidylglycerophosphatase A [Deltaproteobacteria bacterium]